MLRVGPRNTTLCSLSPSGHNRWVFGEVTVGRVPRDFNILFQVSGKLKDDEYFAIDDIDFTNCSLPGKASSQWNEKIRKRKERREVYFCTVLCRVSTILSREYVPVQQQSVCGAQQDLWLHWWLWRWIRRDGLRWGFSSMEVLRCFKSPGQYQC